MSAANNDNDKPPKMPGGITGKGYKPGQTGNPDGVPGWVKRARDAMRDEVFPAAQAHLLRVLTGKRPPDARPDDDKLYASVTIDDRNVAARIAYEYSIPKPKAQAGLKHEGGAVPVVVEVRTLAEDKPGE